MILWLFEYFNSQLQRNNFNSNIWYKYKMKVSLKSNEIVLLVKQNQGFKTIRLLSLINKLIHTDWANQWFIVFIMQKFVCVLPKLYFWLPHLFNAYLVILHLYIRSNFKWLIQIHKILLISVSSFILSMFHEEITR